MTCWRIWWYTYWKSAHYRIDPPEPYNPSVLVKLGYGGFAETRNIASANPAVIPPTIAMCHHMSYARSDELILKKHIAAPGHSQTMIDGWFENVWRRWDSDPTLTDLHPVNPAHYQRAVRQAPQLIPEILREVYESESGLP